MAVGWKIGTGAAVILALAVGCARNDDDDKNDSGTSPNTTGNPSMWLVGDKGEMLRVGQPTAEGAQVDTYPLDVDADLLAITCVGERTAWVVGTGGTVLLTRDAGSTWTVVDAGTDADLVAVAASEHDDGQRVFAAGTDGALIFSADSGRTWVSLDAADVDWTGVATDEPGSFALVSGSDGTVWRTDGAELERMYAVAEQPLRGVALSARGDAAAAVGDLGFLSVSRDYGRSWTAVDLPTARDLFAVRIGEDADTVVAVGAAGTVAHVDGRGVSVASHLDSDLALRALHLHATGRGQAVGDAGVVLMTQDLGTTWLPVEVGTTVTLRGVDDFRLGGHL